MYKMQSENFMGRKKKQLREMVKNGIAEDISTGTNETRNEIESVEGKTEENKYFNIKSTDSIAKHIVIK